MRSSCRPHEEVLRLGAKEEYQAEMLALALSQAATAFHLGGAARPLSVAIVPSISPQHPAFMMAADSYTSKDELLLEEEIERSGVEEELEKPKAVDLSLADKVDWTPSARGEPGKTPRDLKYGPLNM